MLGLEGWGPVSTALTVGVVSLLMVKIWQTYRYLTTFRRLGIPGPTPLPLVGNMMTVFRKNFVEAMTDWEGKYGNIYGIFFPKPAVVVLNKEMAKEVLIKQFAKFSDRPDFPGISTGPFKDSLLSIKGDHWKHVRGQLSPTFSTNKLKRILPVIARVSKNLCQHLQQYADNGEMFELREVSRKVTMNAIAGAAFGLEVDSLKNPDDQFYRNAEGLINKMNSRVAIFTLFGFLQKITEPLGFGLVPLSHTKYLMDVLDAAIEDRRQDKVKHGDFLQLLVEAEKAGWTEGQVDSEIDFGKQLHTSTQWTRKGLTLSEIHSNSLIFLFAGYETVSSVMSLVLFALAANQDCLRKVQEEVDEKIDEGSLDYDSIMDLTYLDMCLNEALRLYMPVLLAREAAEDLDLGGHHVPKFTQILIPTSIFHLDPSDWPNPMTFDPERHSVEGKGNRHPVSFMPFGLGPRNCIGMRLAQVEIRMMIASILQRYTPVLCEKSVFPPVFKPLSTITRDGLWVRLKRREDAN